MTVTLYDKKFELYIPSEKILKRVDELAKEISQEYILEQPLIIIGVLNGCILFLTDLIKNLTINCELEFIRFSSYSGTTSTGEVKVLMGFDRDIRAKRVLIVEDIVDTGLTLERVFKEITKLGPKEIKIATLLLKPKVYQKNIPIDYIGFEIPPNFVVGYGLDYNGIGRNLKDIYSLVK